MMDLGNENVVREEMGNVTAAPATRQHEQGGVRDCLRELGFAPAFARAVVSGFCFIGPDRSDRTCYKSRSRF